MIRSLSLSVAIATAACGGAGAAPGPGPLRHHFDELHIAQVSKEEKQELLRAQSEYHRAKAEKMKAEADQEDVKAKLQLARDEKKRAEEAREKAAEQKSAAGDSDDNARKNAATRDDRVAELTLRTADQRVDTLAAKKKWLEELLRYTEENTYAAEAKVELAKARLAREHNISPPGFAMQAYVDQYEERSRRAQRAKVIADRQREKWQVEEKDYQAKKVESDRARGVDTASKGTK